MKRIFLILCMALSLVACDKGDNPQSKPVVKIGASFPLSGNMASIGNAAHRALVAAIDDANANKQNKYFYKLTVENDQMEPKVINTVANKFIYQDKVDVIVSFFSGAGRIVAPMAAKNGTINFSFGYDDVVLQSKYNFQNFLTGESENNAAIDFFKSMSVTNVDLVYQNIGAADQLLKPLTEKLQDAGIKYDIHRFNKGETDFKVLVSKLKNSKSDALFIYAFEPESDILTREFRTQNLNKIIAYSDGLPMTNDYALYDGYYNVGSFVTPDDLKQKWGLDGQNAAYSAYLYDTGHIIVDAYENAESTDAIPTADAISEYLLSREDYSGVVGKYKLDKRGQFHSAGQTTVVQDGKLVPYKK